MNATRKQIIDLISEYMDKSLEFWCMIYNIKYKTYWLFDIKEKLDDRCEIIWHYDLSVVLKYIENKVHDFKIAPEIWWFNTFQIGTWNWLGYDHIWSIKNKPLHLYTEQEEKDLLELLQKLWEK